MTHVLPLPTNDGTSAAKGSATYNIITMSLPQTVVFSIKDVEQQARYLSFTGPQRQLRCDTEEGVFSDNARFAVERSVNGLVQIRSCFENHYWARASRFEPWLLASSPEREEDTTKDGCTLFRPRFSAGNVFVGFVHVQSNLNVVVRPAADAYAYNLTLEATAPTDFSFADFSPFARTNLPRYIMFLGHDDKYMSAISTVTGGQTVVHIRFPKDNPTHRTEVLEVEHTKSADIQLKSMLHDEFFEVEQNTNNVLIRPGNPTGIPNNSLFEVNLSKPSASQEQGVALRSVRLDRFCYKSSAGQGALLVGATSPIDNTAWFRPRHAAHPDKRRVNIESFRHAVTFPRSIRYIIQRNFSNPGDTVLEHSFSRDQRMFTYITFSNSLLSFRGPSAVFNGRMPFVNTSGNLEHPTATTNTTADWGNRQVHGVDKTYNFKISIPPKSRLNVMLYLNIATYEVPFSYKQLDELPFGGPVTQDLHDGAFHIIGQYDVEMRPRDPSPLSESADIPLGVEVEGEPGLFVYDEVPDPQSSMDGDEFDQGADHELGGVEPDSTDPISQEN